MFRPCYIKCTDLHAYNMLLMKVAGAEQRGVSMMKAKHAGPAAASASVRIAPEADQVNISICPGVSSIM